MHRIICCRDLYEARRELNAVRVSTQGIEVMAPKALGWLIKLTGVRLGAANILKQEMLSLGGDAAVARGVVDGKAEISDVLLLGGLEKYRKLLRKLDYQHVFGLAEIQKFIQSVLPAIGNLPNWTIDCRHRQLDLSPTRVMGIINVTPDSFSDRGAYFNTAKAVEHARRLIDDGADMLDLGGESSRPGSDPVSVDEEISRIVPVIEGIRAFSDIPISVDTTKAAVMDAALRSGADILNDITALRGDPGMPALMSAHPDVPVILMHMQGIPKTMQDAPAYCDIIDDLLTFFTERLQFCSAQGIASERVILDPGIGFGKNQEHNLTLVKRSREFLTLGRPILLGHSRKTFIGSIYNATPGERLAGTLAVTALAYENDLSIVRVHDVRANRELLQTLSAVRRQGE